MKNIEKNNLSVRPHLIILLILTASIAVIYWQVRNFEFTNFDDYTYVTVNPHVNQGISLESVIWAFKSFYAANWHPVTWISHMIDVELYGMVSGPHHLMNVFIHIINTLLLFFILFKMTSGIWQSAMVALLFAIHPLHVESVAWVAERKDLLCTFWAFLTINSYINYCRTQHHFDYFKALLFFALGLMSKPMLVTLPLLLLFFDYWPLGRISLEKRMVPSDFFRLGFKTNGYLKDKIPFFLLIVVSCIITFMAQYQGGAVGTFEKYPVYSRLANAIVSYVVYLGKMIWPSDLSVFYPYTLSLPVWQIVGAGILISFISIGALIFFKTWPFVIVGWGWYLVSLLPVIGIVQVGAQAYADRYTYIPSIGIFIMIIWALAALVSRYSINPWVFIPAILCISLIMMRSSWIQVSHWKNIDTLFSHSIKVVDNNYIGHNNLGCYLVDRGDLNEAIEHFQKAIHIFPGYTEAYDNLGRAFFEQSRFEESIWCFESALKQNTKHYSSFFHMGLAMLRLGLFEKAMSNFEIFFKLRPDFNELTSNHGIVLVREKKKEDAKFFFRNTLQMETDLAFIDLPPSKNPTMPEETSIKNPENSYLLALLFHKRKEFDKAEKYYREAIREGYTSGIVYFNLGMLLAQMDRMAESIVYFNKTLDYNYMPPSLFNNFGVIHLRQERIAESIRYLDEACRKDPSFSQAINNSGVALAKLGKVAESEKKMMAAIRSDSQYVNALNNMGLVYIQQKKMNEAIDYFNKALVLAPENQISCYNLAAVYSFQNQIDMALSWLDKALKSGYDNFNLLNNDVLMNNIRALPQFKEVINKNISINPIDAHAQK